MAQRLALLADSARPLHNQFINDQRLAWMRDLEPPADFGGRATADFRLASEMLRAGLPGEAAENLETLAELVEKEGSRFRPDFRHEVKSMLATAHLRVGEQENCLEDHSSDSCLLPIRDGGIHRHQDGSRAALKQLSDLLEEDPEDLLSRWLYNIAAMTVGEYPDGIPEDWLIPPEVFASDHDIGLFRDVAPGAGLATVGLAGGSIVEDFDGDGHLDIMASSWGLRDPLRFFHNRRDGSFEERTGQAGLTGLAGGLNLIHADYDNDGDADVLVLRGAWLGPAGRHPNSLLENRGDVSPEGAQRNILFADVTEAAGLLSFAPTQNGAWGDFNNDGWLDLFIGNESLPGHPQPCELYRNNGPGADGTITFTDVAASAGVADACGYVKGAAWGDVDNDGRLDLYLSRLLQPNLLLHNQGESFVEIGDKAGVSEPIHSFPTWFFDYDNDGWLDIFVSGYPRSYLEAQATQIAAEYLGLPTTADTPRLYRNLGGEGGTGIAFADVTADVGLDEVQLAMGANFGDLDNDGWLDFYLGTGSPDFRALIPNRMFRNDGGGRFQDVTTSGGFGHLQKGHGVSFADLDNDGDQDVFTVIGGAYSGDGYQNALFLNPGHGHRWITLRLEGTASNRSGVGARIRLELETPNGRRQLFRTVSTGGSFGASSLQQEIGLGDASSLPVVEVSWPAGDVQIFHDLPMDRIVKLRQGDSSPTVVELERIELKSHQHH